MAKCTETVQPLERATPVSGNFTSVWHSEDMFASISSSPNTTENITSWLYLAKYFQLQLPLWAAPLPEGEHDVLYLPIYKWALDRKDNKFFYTLLL